MKDSKVSDAVVMSPNLANDLSVHTRQIKSLGFHHLQLKALPTYPPSTHIVLHFRLISLLSEMQTSGHPGRKCNPAESSNTDILANPASEEKRNEVTNVKE